MWTGAKYRGGYGHFRRLVDGEWKMYKAHRYSLEYARNLKPKDTHGKVVMHSCDNPACVNPDHLSMGSIKDNNDDKVSKGRLRFGARDGVNALSYSLASKLRAMYREGYTQAELSRAFKSFWRKQSTNKSYN